MFFVSILVLDFFFGLFVSVSVIACISRVSGSQICVFSGLFVLTVR